MKRYLALLLLLGCTSLASCPPASVGMVHGLFPLPAGLVVDCSAQTATAMQQGLEKLGPQRKLITWNEAYHVVTANNIEIVAAYIDGQLKKRGYTRQVMKNIGAPEFYIYDLAYQNLKLKKVVSITVFNPAAGSGVQMLGN